VVICLERDADLHTAQLMPLSLTVSCFSKIQIGFTFLVPAHLGSPRKGPLNGCVCVSETGLQANTSNLIIDVTRKVGVCGSGSVKLWDVRPSVCLSRLSTAAGLLLWARRQETSIDLGGRRAPLPLHSSTPDLKLSFSANPSHRSLPFLLPD